LKTPRRIQNFTTRMQQVLFRRDIQHVGRLRQRFCRQEL
jgi:hypothetical protein